MVAEEEEDEGRSDGLDGLKDAEVEDRRAVGVSGTVIGNIGHMKENKEAMVDKLL